MNSDIKTFKKDYGYTEYKDVGKYVDTLKNGFRYYYNGEYDDIKAATKITFDKLGRSVAGNVGWTKSFEGRVHKIIWPACNSTKPIVFFVGNTLRYG